MTQTEMPEPLRRLMAHQSDAKIVCLHRDDELQDDPPGDECHWSGVGFLTYLCYNHGDAILNSLTFGIGNGETCGAEPIEIYRVEYREFCHTNVLSVWGWPAHNAEIHGPTPKYIYIQQWGEFWRIETSMFHETMRKLEHAQKAFIYKNWVIMDFGDEWSAWRHDGRNKDSHFLSDSVFGAIEHINRLEKMTPEEIKKEKEARRIAAEQRFDDYCKQQKEAGPSFEEMMASLEQTPASGAGGSPS